MSIIAWLLDADPSIRWQVMRDLTGTPAAIVAAERSRVATEGWGRRLLDQQRPDGRWGDGVTTPFWWSNMYTLVFLRDLGLDPASERSRTAIDLVRRHVTWGPEFGNSPFFDGEVEPCINGRVVAPAWTQFSFPTLWRFDVLRGLDYFRDAGVQPDPRINEAIAAVLERRQSDGCWLLDVRHRDTLHEDIAGTVGAANRWITLRCLRVLDWCGHGPRPQ